MDVPSLILGAVLGGIGSWLVARHFYRLSSEDSSKQSALAARNEAWQKTLGYFESMLIKGTWEKDEIDHQSVWICQEDTALRIESGDEFEDFIEPWTQNYPDKKSKRNSVYLKRNGQTLKELYFIHLDGFRITVPMPKVILHKGATQATPSQIFCWEKDSIDFKVGKVIGEYYIYEKIEEISRISGVDIVDGQLRA